MPDDKEKQGDCKELVKRLKQEKKERERRLEEQKKKADAKFSEEAEKRRRHGVSPNSDKLDFLRKIATRP